MLRDFKNAQQNYELARKDFQNEKERAVKYFAGANVS